MNLLDERCRDGSVHEGQLQSCGSGGPGGAASGAKGGRNRYGSHSLLRFDERLGGLDVGLLEGGEKGHVCRAGDEPYRQSAILLEEAIRLDDEADQLAVVEQDIVDAAQPLTGRAQHHVFVMVDLDLVRRLVGDLLRVGRQPEAAADEVDLFEAGLSRTERAESVAQVWGLAAGIIERYREPDRV